MIIYKPHIIFENNKVKLLADFTVKNKTQSLWFSFNSNSISDYLVNENIDAFLIGLLLLAMKEGENIELKAPVSAKLYYQLTHYIIPALSLANPEWKKIKINYSELNQEGFNPEHNAGTGISGGVDSFSTIVDHLSESNGLQISYFTFFNAGSHGDYGGNETREVFNNRLKLVEPYAREVGIPLIVIDSNLSEILKMKHQQTHTLRSISCVLTLQKLFKYYYYAAAHRFDFFKINDGDMAYYETLLLSMLSTESTTFYSAVSQLTRVERTSIISNYTPTYRYLNVCVDPIKADRGENCSVCNKCLRTELTLDLLGKIKNYDKVFDIEKYASVKEKFVGEVLAERNKNLYYDDIYNLMKKVNYKVGIISYCYAGMYIVRKNISLTLKKSRLITYIYYNIFKRD